MNRLLRERVAQAWKQRQEEIQCLQKRLAELNTEAAARALTVDEQWQRVVAPANVEDDAADPTSASPIATNLLVLVTFNPVTITSVLCAKRSP